MAPAATVTATTNPSHAAAVTDGKVPQAGCRDDANQVWIVDPKSLPAALTFTWEKPTTIATVVYYGRTTWGLDPFKDYEIYVDDAAEPVAKGTFVRGHGPQLVNLPKAVQARKLTLKFLSSYGNGPGAAEVQVFGSIPPASALLCRFSDFAMDFRYAYFPSHNLLRVLVPAPPPDAKKWHIAVTADQGGKVLAEREGSLPMSAAGENLKIPDLADGQYVLTLTLTGGAEPVVEERAFQRHHYDWENQKLGLDDVVIPPFEPLVADAQKQAVNCVLRQHTHGGAGLWRQVTSEDHELLAGPIRLEATSGGKTVVADGAATAFTASKPTQVTGEASWKAGSLAGTTAFTYDYDGLMQLTLNLAPSDAEIEKLQLVIPLKASEAWLMHPVTDTLRHHYAGRIAEGTGKVWDSLKISREKLPGPFVPYIYVGGPQRGICFAADNDRDWITDAKVPAMEIDRDGNTVNLRLNLIARPSKLTRQRTITFSLQATPAKPMPQTPYNWRRWWATGTAPKSQDVQIDFWGGNGYWGGRNFATSFYPAFMDFGYWEQLGKQRRTGKEDKEYEKTWFDRFSDVPPDKRAEFEPAMRAGYQWSAYHPVNTAETTKFRYVIPYTNARGCGAENRDFITTYLDEWQTGDIADPQWKAFSPFQRTTRMAGFGVWYEIEPVPTFLDMVLFYHKKMYETFADGIYWDNFFLRPCYLPAEAGGPAYIDDDGKLRPGVNLMGFRSLVKRNAVMMHQMGKRPLSYVHMTNVNIVPMLSFSTLQLDWEWRDQGEFAKKDLQDRLGADRDTGLILAQSLGLQAGNINVAIDRFNPPKDSGVTREWLFRTVMAVCLPHEIKVYQGTADVSFVQNQLAEFGYGLEDCKVYRYWEEGFPLTSQGGKIHALVLSRGPKALLAIGNYGRGEAAASKPDATATTSSGSVEAYDAEREAGNHKTASTGPAATQPAADEMYAVTLKLDLQTLGLSQTARACYVVPAAKNSPAKKPATSASSPAATAAGDPSHEPELKQIAPGIFELKIRRHDFALVKVE